MFFGPELQVASGSIDISVSYHFYISQRPQVLKMATISQPEKTEVLMLEKQPTNVSDFQKPVPIAGKQDYSGAHEVRRAVLTLLSDTAR